MIGYAIRARRDRGASMPTRAGRVAVAVAVLLATVMVPAPASAYGDGTYTARITRASYGVPHIQAGDFGSLGFGVGHVQAEDDICVIAEKVVTVDGTRSRFLGATGPADPNVRSDL